MPDQRSTESLRVKPDDAFNQELVAQVHPRNWTNPTPASRYNLVVIGGGTAGLVTAAGAAGLGARVALIERNLLGGDCLNVGCVPSKSLIRSSRAAFDIQDAGQFGVHVPPGAAVDFAAVMARMRKLRAGISHHDSAKRFSELGVDVFLGDAKFSGRDTVEISGTTLRFKRAVIATGARAVRPAIAGLSDAGFLTNETVFNLTERPRRLAVIGGGPIGCELAQAFQRLGSQVTLFHRNAHLLDREDPDAAAIVQNAFLREGIRLLLNAKIQRVEKGGTEKVIHFEMNGVSESVAVDEILASTGRAPNIEGLNLDLVGVEFDKREGVRVNDHLQTSNPKIYAAGDVCMKWKFTARRRFCRAHRHSKRAVLRAQKIERAKHAVVYVYTDPEIAHVGLYEREAKERGLELDTFVRSFKDVDRAIVDGEENGFVKIHVKKGSDEILGATMVARHAGEMISEISVAMAAKLGLGKLASVIHPYPTQTEAIRQCGDAYNRTRLTPFVRKLFSRWLNWRR